MKRRTPFYAFVLFTLSVFALTGCSGGGGGSGGGGAAGGGGNNPAPALTVSGRVFAPGGQVATKSKEDALGTIVSTFIPIAKASVSGLLPVPDGTVVELVWMNDAGTVDTVIDSVETTNGRYTFNLTELEITISNGLVVIVSDLGVQIRAFVTTTTIDINPVSEATVQMVIEQIAAVPGTLLENFTFDELDDLNASIDLLTSLEGLATQPGIDPTVQSIKDLVSLDDGIVDYLLSAAEAGQTVVGPGDVGNLFPLDQGNIWEYVVISSEYPEKYYELISVTGTTDINGITAVILSSSNPDNSGTPQDEYIEENTRGLVNWGNTDAEDFLTQELVPYNQEFFPITIGESRVILNKNGLVWRDDLDGDGNFESFDVSAAITTIGLEDVSVPVGTFNSAVKQKINIDIVVYLSGDNSNVDVKQTITQWLTKDIGQVRIESVFVLEAFGQKETITDTSELSAYWIEGESSGVFSNGLDMSFGEAGIVINDDAVSGSDEEARAIDIQKDGKIVIAGSMYDDVMIQRYTKDGALDNNYAESGTFIFDSGESEEAFAVTLQPDGKIIVVGTIHQFNAGYDNVLVLRFDQDGSLDSSFGVNGVVATDVSIYGEIGYTTVLQPDGKIIVGGEVDIGGTDRQGLVLRYNPDGSLDNTFGNGGIYLFDGPNGGWDTAYGMALQSDGKIIVTGSTSTTGSIGLTDIFVLRLGSEGNLDTVFGTEGVVIYDSDYASSNYDVGKDVMVQQDGMIVVSASHFMFRLNSDGAFDQTYGDDGFVPFQGLLTGLALEFTDDGKSVVAGFSGANAAVLRVTGDGSVDTTFFEDGLIEISSGGLSQALGLSIQDDGKVVIAGNSTFHDSYSDKAIFLARLVAQ